MNDARKKRQVANEGFPVPLQFHDKIFIRSQAAEMTPVGAAWDGRSQVWTFQPRAVFGAVEGLARLGLPAYFLSAAETA